MRTKPPKGLKGDGHKSVAGILRTDWEMSSDALGCHPDEIPRFEEEARRAGLTGVRFVREEDQGTPVFESIRAKRAYEHAYGYQNKGDFL